MRRTRPFPSQTPLSTTGIHTCRCLPSVWSDLQSDHSEYRHLQCRNTCTEHNDNPQSPDEITLAGLAVCRGRPIPEQARPFPLTRLPVAFPVAFVPARWPGRANVRGGLSANERPFGRAGWHRACPYTRQTVAPPFGRICNPTTVNIGICNAKYDVADSWRSIANANIHLGWISNPAERLGQTAARLSERRTGGSTSPPFGRRIYIGRPRRV